MKKQIATGSCSQKLTSSLQGIDRFGSQISLTLNKQTKFTTSAGGVLSLLAWMGAIAYFGYCLHRVNSNEYQMASIDGYKGNVFDYTHNLTGHFDPAFMVQYAGTNMDVYANMDTYFTMYVQQLFQSTDPMTGAVSMTLEYEYNMMKCNLERFGSDLYEEAYSYGLANYWCMNGTELYISGGSRLFSVFFDYCNQTFLDRMYPGQGKVCKTIDQITPELSRSVLYRYFKNSYLDYNEFVKMPIKGYLRNNAYNVIPGVTQQNTILATIHSAELQDNKFSGYAAPQQYNYYDFDSVKQELQFEYDPHYSKFGSYYPNGVPLLQFNFQLNAQFTTKQRRVFTVLDAVSQTGGIAGVLIGFFSIINSLFQSALFKLQLMGLLYTMQKRSHSKIKFKNKNQENSSKGSNSSDSQKTPQNLISLMINRITEMQPFKIETRRLIWYEIQKKFCFCRGNLVSKNLIPFTQAEQKLDQELDLIFIMKKLRRVDFLTKMLVNANYFQLIQYGEDSNYQSKKDSVIQDEKEDFNLNTIQKKLQDLAKDSKTSANAQKLFKMISHELNDQTIPLAQQKTSSILKLNFNGAKQKKSKKKQDEESQIINYQTIESPKKQKRTKHQKSPSISQLESANQVIKFQKIQQESVDKSFEESIGKRETKKSSKKQRDKNNQNNITD
eukprot:403373182